MQLLPYLPPRPNPRLPRLIDDCVPFWFPRCVDRQQFPVVQLMQRVLILLAGSMVGSFIAWMQMGTHAAPKFITSIMH
jgi:hypothetical protein